MTKNIQQSLPLTCIGYTDITFIFKLYFNREREIVLFNELDSLFHIVGKENNGNLLAYWERHLVTYNKSDCLVIRAFSMSRLILNVLWNEIGRLFAIKSNINKVN